MSKAFCCDAARFALKQRRRCCYAPEWWASSCLLSMLKFFPYPQEILLFSPPMAFKVTLPGDWRETLRLKWPPKRFWPGTVRQRTMPLCWSRDTWEMAYASERESSKRQGRRFGEGVCHGS